jgi:DNA-binding MarR family transcriptional regulator
MKPHTHLDMHLLNEVTQRPDATQRELSQRIGVALGLTNLMLRRLAKKGYIKVINVQKCRLRYLITPQGLMEKARLTSEYVEYSLFFYRNVRTFLREHLGQSVRAGHREILLWGTGELAEIAFLTIREMGLELVGVVEDPPDRERFLGYPVRELREASTINYDRILGASQRWQQVAAERLVMLELPVDRLIAIPQVGGTSRQLPQEPEPVKVPRDAAASQKSSEELAVG